MQRSLPGEPTNEALNCAEQRIGKQDLLSPRKEKDRWRNGLNRNIDMNVYGGLGMDDFWHSGVGALRKTSQVSITCLIGHSGKI